MMNKRQPANASFWSIFFRILVFCLALYLAYLILRPLISILLGIGFWLIKVLVFLTATVLVVHLFLKLIFQIDLLHLLFGAGWKK